jgi:ArsR family metal-binding transcriptional regulator
MTIVNGFDIDTEEGATAYLESEGINVEEYVKRGMAELKRNRALDLADVSGSLPDGYCKYCGKTPCERLGISIYPEDI